MNDAETIMAWLEKQSHVEISRQIGTAENPPPLYLVSCGIGGRKRSVQSKCVQDGLFGLMATENTGITLHRQL